ncbi:MAG: hypothetical protein AABZ74_13485 [Cyanobacteriota bacterium]
MSLAVGASPSINLPTKQAPASEPIKAQNPVSPNELNWALALERNPATPSPEETAKYEEISQRLQKFGIEKSTEIPCTDTTDKTISNKYVEPKAATNVGFVDSAVALGKRAKDGVLNAGKAVLNTVKTDSAVKHAIGGAAVGAVVGGPVGAAVGATVGFAFSKLFDMFKSKGPIGSAFNTNATESQKKSISFTAAGAALGSVAGPGGALFGASLGYLASKIKVPEKH